MRRGGVGHELLGAVARLARLLLAPVVELKTRMRITDYLLEDHVRLHGLLARTSSSGTFDPESFAEFRRGLLRHIAIEEKLLFPAIRAARGVPLALAYELRVEHAALTSLLVPTPDLALVREIYALLGAHDAREEGLDGVYAECQQVLGPERCAELGVRAASYPQVRVTAHFDGPRAYRTSDAALAAARRMKRFPDPGGSND